MYYSGIDFDLSHECSVITVDHSSLREVCVEFDSAEVIDIDDERTREDLYLLLSGHVPEPVALGILQGYFTSALEEKAINIAIDDRWDDVCEAYFDDQYQTTRHGY